MQEPREHFAIFCERPQAIPALTTKAAGKVRFSGLIGKLFPRHKNYAKGRIAVALIASSLTA